MWKTEKTGGKCDKYSKLLSPIALLIFEVEILRDCFLVGSVERWTTSVNRWLEGRRVGKAGTFRQTVGPSRFNPEAACRSSQVGYVCMSFLVQYSLYVDSQTLLPSATHQNKYVINEKEVTVHCRYRGWGHFPPSSVFWWPWFNCVARLNTAICCQMTFQVLAVNIRSLSISWTLLLSFLSEHLFSVITESSRKIYVPRKNFSAIQLRMKLKLFLPDFLGTVSMLVSVTVTYYSVVPKEFHQKFANLYFSAAVLSFGLLILVVEQQQREKDELLETFEREVRDLILILTSYCALRFPSKQKMPFSSHKPFVGFIGTNLRFRFRNCWFCFAEGEFELRGFSERWKDARRAKTTAHRTAYAGKSMEFFQ